MRTRHYIQLLGMSMFTLSACSEGTIPQIQTQAGVSIQQIRAAAIPRHASDSPASELSLGLRAVSQDGSVLPCEGSDIQVSLAVSTNGIDGKWEQLPANKVSVQCRDHTSADVALVVDNSGSQEIALSQTQLGAARLIARVLEPDGRVSITRVSTQAAVLTELDDNEVELQDVVDGLFVNKGWTALYDGVRLGHETLGRELVLDTPAEATTNEFSNCQQRRRAAIVLFTNGGDNNSADEKLADGSDGMNTLIEDLRGLGLNGVTTPIFTVGLGKQVDEALLQQLAYNSGGQYLAVNNVDSIGTGFDHIADYLGQSIEVCAELPKICGTTHVQLTYSYTNDSDTVFSDSQIHTVHGECKPEEPAMGRAAALLVALSDVDGDASTTETLTKNLMDWVSPSDDPKVLLVRDDNHHGEHKNEIDEIRSLLQSAGHMPVLMDEPNAGLSLNDLASYDVVWFSNPGWPVDDFATYVALSKFQATGGGIILSGDDIAWSMGHSFSMTPLTHLEFDNNGASICGKKTDGGKSGEYEVTLRDDSSHPILTDISGQSFRYANDIDHTTAIDESEVLAWGTLAKGGKSCKTQIPVLVGYDPASAE